MPLSTSAPRESTLMSEDSPVADLLDSEAAYSTKPGSAFLGTVGNYSRNSLMTALT